MIVAREQHLSQPSKLCQYFRTLRKNDQKMTELRYLRILRFSTGKYNKHLEKRSAKSIEELWKHHFAHEASRLLASPIPAADISSLPLLPVPLYSGVCPTPFFSPFFCSTHPPLPPITPCRLLPLYRRQQKQNSPPSNYWTFSHTSVTPMILSASAHTRTHTHFLCVCAPPFAAPSSTSPSDLSSLSSAQLLSSWAHSVVGVRVDWPESASWAPSSFIWSATFTPPPSFVSPPLRSASPVHPSG